MKARVQSRLMLCAVLGHLSLVADTPKDTPVGMLLVSGDSKLLRANTETPLDAKTPDLLFSGDGIRTGASPATFLFCAGKSTQVLGPGSEVRLEPGGVKVTKGKVLSQKPSNSCFLPQMVRVAVASQQHYGASMTRGDSQVPPVPRDKIPPAVIAEIEPLEKEAAANPDDPSPLAAIAAVYEKANLPANALATYEALKKKFPDAEWLKSKIFELDQFLADQKKAAESAGPGGNTYILLVGVSKYKKPELALQYPDKDAESFAEAFTSPRGGAIPKENVLLLTNEKATTAAVRNGFTEFLKQKAGKKDTVVIMMAGHGIVESPGTKKGYVLTYDADPQDLPTTSMPMDELRTLFSEQVARVGRVLMFVDVCRSGTIGSINNTNINNDVSKLQEAEGDLFLFMASRPRELSYEGPQFGGGHGAFSYFVLKALMGDADEDKNNKVDIDEMIKYVRDKVEANTNRKQHPNETGNFQGGQSLSDLSKPGMQLAHWPILYDSRSGEPLYLASGAPEPPLQQDASLVRDLADFDRAISERRLLPGENNDAFGMLDRLQGRLTPENFERRRNQLRIALEERAQEVLLRYLQGDQIPQTQSDFAAGARDMEAARKLTPESLFLEGRQDFFQGRAMLFDKTWAPAAKLLEQSIRIDPQVGYPYNALGIAYLEQAQFDRAIPAFRDAVRRAPHWAYPLHNLALAYAETGDYNGAIRSYTQAMRLAPKVSYLPYNLGLVYQRTGRRKEAERYYRQAMSITPDSAEPYNALGTVKASQGKRADAERLYKQALEKNPKLLAARSNLALLLSTQANRFVEAEQLWKQNLADAPDHLPSRLALAEAFAANNRPKDAIAQYEEVIRAKPEYVGARVALAQQLAKDNRRADALTQLREAARREPADASIQELIGDFEAASGNTAGARTAYEAAMKQAPDSSARKSIRKKIERLQK